MTRKRRMFDIDLPEVETTPPAEAGEGAARRGPMASAVRENAEALRERQALEERIRAENDALAHEHVRLKRQGLVLDMIPTHFIDAMKLTRDRSAPEDTASLAELKASIMAIGLSNPIRVEKKENNRYELIQGWRRLRAFIELEGEYRDGRFTHIPVGYVAAGDSLELSYRRMVDENLVRKDVSFAEMARLARAYVADPDTRCDDIDKAVTALFRSAGYQKRSYIRAFAELLDVIGDRLLHPQALGRNLGLDLRRRIEAEPTIVPGLRAALDAAPTRTAAEELAILREFAEPRSVVEPGRGAAATPRATAAPRSGRAKTTLRIDTPFGEMRCLASNGRLDLRGPADFGVVDPRRLEQALASFFAAVAGQGD
jgi:ParB family transcriptional regulator, chromosome partitioning protein